MNSDIKSKFNSYPLNIRPKLERLRELIFEVAANTEGVGKLEEALKWGEPAFLTSQSKSGTTIRIDWKDKNPNQYAMYFNCQTTLIETVKTLFPELKTEGSRAILFNISDQLPEDEIRNCIAMALTYHQSKKNQR